jgi:hypothetical protein
VPAKYLLGHGALLQLASQEEDSALFRWSQGIDAADIQTSVLAIAIARARVERSTQGKERELWLEGLDQLENDLTVHAGPPLVVDLEVAKEWAGLRYADLKSLVSRGAPKSTSQDVRLVIATALAHELTLVDDILEPYHAQLQQWGGKVLVPS